MSKKLSLLEQADLFEKLALAPQPQLAQLINNQKNLILSEIRDGISIINSLVTTSKAAAQSRGIQALDDFFGQVASFVQSLGAENGSEAAQSILQQISNVAFFTQAGNAGMGYDPATHLGGARSPAVILDKITAHIKTIISMLTQKPTQTNLA